MQVAIYARASTLNQQQEGTIASQVRLLKQHIQQQNWSLLPEYEFLDEGISGARLDRPALDRLRDCAQRGEFDAVVVLSPDRLARNYAHQWFLVEEFEKLHTQLIFLQNPFGDSPQGKLLTQMQSMIAERMRRGRLAKLRAGLILPWTRPPYGYRLDPQRPRAPAGARLEEAEAVIVEEIFTWYIQEGRSLFGFVTHLHDQNILSPGGKPYRSTATLRGILTNPAYTGQVYAGCMHYRPSKIRRSATNPIGRHHDSVERLPPEQWIAVAPISAVITQQQFEQV
jgi:site-specific DNA recombinase